MCKHKEKGNIEYAPVYFISATKTVINSDKYDLDKSFQEILFRIDNWINQSGWIIQSIETQYVNISNYSPLTGSICIELPDILKNLMKGLINIQSNDNKCFLWCHIRHLNPPKIHPERITKVNKKLLMILIMKKSNFLFLSRIIEELKDRTTFALMCSVMKMV